MNIYKKNTHRFPWWIQDENNNLQNLLESGKHPDQRIYQPAKSTNSNLSVFVHAFVSFYDFIFNDQFQVNVIGYKKEVNSEFLMVSIGPDQNISKFITVVFSFYITIINFPWSTLTNPIWPEVCRRSSCLVVWVCPKACQKGENPRKNSWEQGLP